MSEIQIKRPLWMTLTVCGFAAVLFSSVAIGGTAWYRQSVATEDAVNREVAGDLALIETDMAAQKKAASALALALAGQPEIAQLIESNARDEILGRFAGSLPAIISEGGLQLITFANASGEVVARIHNPEKFGDDMKGRRKTVVEALSSGKLVAGTEPGLAAVSMFASAPVVRDGNTVGIVDVGTGLTNAYFTPLSERIGGEIAVHILVDGKLMKQASTSESTFLSPETLQAAFDGTPVREQVTTATGTMIVKTVPFNNFSGTKIGVLEIASDVTAVVEDAQAALWSTIAGTLIVSLLSLIGFFAFARSLAGVLGRLTATMSQLAGGNLDALIEGETRPDEIGAMARAVKVFKDNAIHAKQLERESESQRSQTEEERRRTAEKDRIRTEAMAQATSGLADGLKQLAAGNLGFQLSQSFADEFESLRADFNQAVLQLKDTLTSISKATGAIDSGAREVSHSADDLSKRTEQQAASLEETAAALDQITTNVSNSSKRAEEARAVAIQANQNATASGQVVANAVDAMGKIEQSSNQISNIIGVIDDIAFQTNLLALNAGVEAARAGDAGKGFAVVAQEVRELAQRSATAAKEIKALIRNSSVEVANGVQLVSQTGEALKTIEAYIVTINQHMDSIATSSKEQSLGLNEVNTAVNQMDQVTQQNAAMVEETNAAGATLASEASRLRELIGQFDLDGDKAPAGVLRSTATVMAAHPNATPAPSPARGMVGKIAKAFGAKGSAAIAASTESWEEF
ncbi:methyl-accepting chemotaxis protein [Agrobacterium albertimagni AOL15]|uniref:Methyl-accepting chemotaxis protein n=1 Tax=Agrobacterium albertimagni AOL15 TaxID=1156935 RepID=K2Q8L8_9HYPH|nr:methyl-accepting chemotaxis protein [Agrobacterium albertimagni]EKF61555.1 methyl-accepting chemotaxis protein [Agrobacterium albertimagni AOL15]